MQTVSSIQQLPRQAWLLRLDSNGISGAAGTGVMRGADWLYEGGFACTDHPRSLSTSGVYLGSGAAWDGQTLSLIAPSHTLDAVYILQARGVTYASNSLPFVMTASGKRNLPIVKMKSAIGSVRNGVRAYVREIYSTTELRLFRYLNAIVRCSPGSDPIEIPQMADLSRIHSFETYRDYLISMIQDVSRNYGSRGITVYLSSGYDSTACAALAKASGLECTAISVDQARTRQPDEGTAVAQALGIPIVTLKRPDRRFVIDQRDRVLDCLTDSDFERLSDFYIGTHVEDECLSAPAELLAGRTILTGYHGDRVWDPLYASGDNLCRKGSSGACMGEFRLRVGFVHIPVPMLAFGAHATLQRIGRSREMRPWRKVRNTRIKFLQIPVNPIAIKSHPMVAAIGHFSKKVADWRTHSGYDRPIARRIAEEMGVPREAFGQRKLAAATLVQDQEMEAVAPQLLERLLVRYDIAAQLILSAAAA